MMKLENGAYQLSGGIDPLELCEKYDCPLYVYDAAIMERQYWRMVKAFQVPRLRINYACKALTNLNVLKLFRMWGAGLDTVSIQEVMLGTSGGL
jgi:diaminopimelate decarboxylase